MAIALAVLLACCASAAVAQFENGISFSEGSTNAAKPTQSAATTFIVNQQNCRCVLIGTCAFNGNNGIDIRIVNVGTTPSPCQTGYQSCCTPPTSQPSTVPPADTTCGIRKIPVTRQPVVGQASFGAYPWQAALLTKAGENYLGSGVLMDATHVVTAAHKVAAYANNPEAMLVRLGDWNGRASTEPYQPVSVNVARVVLHPNFNSVNLDNDVAVIRLNGVVPIASYPNINTACKPTAAVVANQRCYVSGWGKNAFAPNGQYQAIMREVDVPIIDQASCEARLRQTRLGPNFVLNRNSFICAGGESGKDACTGDGGSPLVCQTNTGQWQVVGLVAWGIGCANTNVPGVYTNFWNFLPWINAAITTA
ncbi:phenoloxidase-activating factor 2-like [Phymastichus coffea]|uniref:phenoloxidase-activating factor 2-like n=1 Tax=Phymastichus coffea TaxID=108790 RepID=UPI00273AD488|nr:phenoloxidase-activating factor 2-like [Phymastichus coffea]